MKTLIDEESGFNRQHVPIAEAGGGMPIADTLGAAAVWQELDTNSPEQPAHRASVITGTVDIGYLHKTGLVRRPGDWSVSA